jgi:hypothetical protein
MEENLPNKVDRLFNDALKKIKSDPSDNVWQKIEIALDEEDRKIALLSFRWKQYTVGAILLIVALGFSMKFYFHQQEMFKLTSSSGLKEINTLSGAKKMNLYGNKGQPKANSHVDRNTKMTSMLNLSPEEKMRQVSMEESEKNKLTNLNFRHHVSESGVTVLESGNDLTKVLSAPIIEPPLPAKSITLPVLPNDEAKNKQLTLVHQKTALKKRISITPYFLQEFAGYSLTDNDLTGSNGQEIEEHERNVFSASVGVYVNYMLSRRWVLQSGISYSWSNSNIDSGVSYAVKDNHGNVQYKLNTVSGYGYLHSASLRQPNVGDSVSTGKSYSQLHYLTIPLILSYWVPLGRFSLLIGAGGSFNVLTSAEIETKTYGNGDPEKEYAVNMMGLKKVNYGMILKLDLEYNVNSRLGVNMIPCFKNTLTPINLESSVTAYPYNFGIGLGMTYRF